MASLLKSSPYELYSHQDILQKTYHRPLKLYHLQSIKEYIPQLITPRPLVHEQETI